MPWWSWFLIWCLLVLGLLAVLVWFAVRLFRKAVGILHALESLNDQVAAIDLELAPAPDAFTPAVFADIVVLLHTVEQRRAEKVHRRQLRRDAWIVRGKLLRNAR